MEATNKVLVDLGRAWQTRSPDCGLKGPWGNATLFASRVEPLLPTLKSHQGRLFALWLFDEPDVGHGGPPSSEPLLPMATEGSQIDPIVDRWEGIDP